jgi:hypothetical protein
MLKEHFLAFILCIAPALCLGETTTLEGVIEVQGGSVILKLDSDYTIKANNQSVSSSILRLEGIGNYNAKALEMLQGHKVSINGNVYAEKDRSSLVFLVRNIPSLTTSSGPLSQGKLILPNSSNIPGSQSLEKQLSTDAGLSKSSSFNEKTQKGFLTINEIKNIKINNIYIWNTFPEEIKSKMDISFNRLEYYKGDWEVYKSMQNNILEIHASLELDLGSDGNFTIRTEYAGGTFYSETKSLIGKWSVFTIDNKDYIFFAFTDENGKYVEAATAPVISRSHSYLNLFLGTDQFSLKRVQ